MQPKEKIIYNTVAKIVRTKRKSEQLPFTIFCYENDIPKTTLSDIENSRHKSSFSNIFLVIKALGLTFEEFGALLDKELPKDFDDIE